MLDEHTGQGGTYLLDPETGVRTLIRRTQTSPQQSQEQSDGTANQETSDSDRGGIDL
jgi:hypothetical protein